MQQLVVRPLHCSPLGQVIYIVADGYYVLADVYRLYTPQHLVAIHYSTASYHRLVEYLYTLQHFDYSSMYMYGLYLGEILYSSMEVRITIAVVRILMGYRIYYVEAL